MAEILSFNQSAAEYARLAGRALVQGDLERAVLFSNKALELDKNNVEAALCLGTVYMRLAEYETALKVFFSVMGENYNRFADLADLCAMGLGVEYGSEFAEAGAPNVLGLDNAFEAFIWKEISPLVKTYVEAVAKNAGFALVGGERAIEIAELLVKVVDSWQTGKFKEAVKLIERTDKYPPQFRAAVAGTKVLGALISGEYKKAVEEREYLKNSGIPDMRFALVSAYSLSGMTEEAFSELKEIIASAESVSALLKFNVELFANATKNHAYALELAEALLKAFPKHKFPLFIKAEALYNKGVVEEALSVFRHIEALYGKYSEAGYYLERLAAASPPTRLDYSENKPPAVVRENDKRLHKMLGKFSQQKVGVAEYAIKYQPEISAMLKEALRSSSEEVSGRALAILNRLLVLRSREILEEAMIDLSCDKHTRIDAAICLLTGWGELSAPLVSGYRFTQLKLYLPNFFRISPMPLQEGYVRAVRYILMFDDEPSDSAAVVENLFDTLESRLGTENYTRFFTDNPDAELPYLIAAALAATAFPEDEEDIVLDYFGLSYGEGAPYDFIKSLILKDAEDIL